MQMMNISVYQYASYNHDAGNAAEAEQLLYD